MTVFPVGSPVVVDLVAEAVRTRPDLRAMYWRDAELHAECRQPDRIVALLNEALARLRVDAREPAEVVERFARRALFPILTDLTREAEARQVAFQARVAELERTPARLVLTAADVAALPDTAWRRQLFGTWEPVIEPGSGPHVLTAEDGRQAYCGGPGCCRQCDKHPQRLDELDCAECQRPILGGGYPGDTCVSCFWAPPPDY